MIVGARVQNPDNPFDMRFFALPRDEVEVLLDRLGLKGRHFHTCSLSVLQGTTKRNAKVPDYLTTAGSLKQMLQWHVDIRSIVKKVSRSIEL